MGSTSKRDLNLGVLQELGVWVSERDFWSRQESASMTRDAMVGIGAEATDVVVSAF